MIAGGSERKYFTAASDFGLRAKFCVDLKTPHNVMGLVLFPVKTPNQPHQQDRGEIPPPARRSGARRRCSSGRWWARSSCGPSTLTSPATTPQAPPRLSPPPNPSPPSPFIPSAVRGMVGWMDGSTYFRMITRWVFTDSRARAYWLDFRPPNILFRWFALLQFTRRSRRPPGAGLWVMARKFIPSGRGGGLARNPEEGADVQEETGWKLVHADVFRGQGRGPPPPPSETAVEAATSPSAHPRHREAFALYAYYGYIVHIFQGSWPM